MAASVFYTPRYRAVDANGDPLAGAVLEFFEAGTSTPLAVYADVDLQVSLGVTVTADSGGLFAEMFMLPQAYDVDLYDADGVLVWSAVNFFPPQPASSANVDVTGIAGVDLGAGEPAYLSDGSAGLNAGQWYPTSATNDYSSSLPQTAFAVTAIAAGVSGLFRTNGKVTGLSGLVPGASYYVDVLAGTITATEPASNVRFLGQAESTTVLVVSTVPPVKDVLPAVIPLIDDRVKTLCNGRLTLTTGVPVTTADVTAATTVYWTPYQGNEVAFYDGAAWVTKELAELSIAVPATTAKVYDAFVDYNGGTPQLAVTAWTNDTTRATALTTQDGVLVQTGNLDWRYVGSFRTTGVSGQTEDSYANRFLWNYYHRVTRPMRRLETTDNWTYTTASFQQANASAANQLNFLIGVAEVTFRAVVYGFGFNGGAVAYLQVSIGLDSATTPATGVIGQSVLTPNNGGPYTASAELVTIPAAGYHFAAWLERSGATTNTTTWYGDIGLSSNPLQSGIVGWIEG